MLKKVTRTSLDILPAFWLLQNTFVLILDSNPHLACAFREFAPSHIYCIQKWHTESWFSNSNDQKFITSLLWNILDVVFTTSECLNERIGVSKGILVEKIEPKIPTRAPIQKKILHGHKNEDRVRTEADHSTETPIGMVLTHFKPSSDVENLFPCVVCAHSTTWILLATTQIRFSQRHISEN